jgi:acetyl esterase/lipase
MKIYKPSFYVVIMLLFAAFPAMAQKTIPLYKGAVPNSKDVPDLQQSNASHTVLSQVSIPTLSIYLPPKDSATGTAMILCPGGGYHNLVIGREGYDMAKRLSALGVAAFVLKYRLPSDRTMKDKTIGPLQDAQQAIKLVRLHAKEWGVDPHKVGIMGFSAGGHLASTAGTHFDEKEIEDTEGVSLRPDFMVLVYPVISFTDAIGHIGSRNNLLGKSPSAALIHKFSNEQQVTAATPPAFIIQAGDDSTVKVENSIVFYEALHKYRIPAALHIYMKGGHGFGKYPPRDVWMKDLVYWMKMSGWLPGHP